MMRGGEERGAKLGVSNTESRKKTEEGGVGEILRRCYRALVLKVTDSQGSMFSFTNSLFPIFKDYDNPCI